MGNYVDKTDMPRYLGWRLRALRKGHANPRYRTQQGFAELLGVDERTLRHWECDGVYKVDVIMYVAAALGVEWWEVISSDDDLPLFLLLNWHYAMPKNPSESNENLKADKTHPLIFILPVINLASSKGKRLQTHKERKS